MEYGTTLAQEQRYRHETTLAQEQRYRHETTLAQEQKGKYETIFIQEQEGFDVEASLQTALYRRRIEMTQQEIHRDFEKAKEGGLDFGTESLDRFLWTFGLKSSFNNPLIVFATDIDVVLRDLQEDKDFLLSYNPGHLTNAGNANSNGKINVSPIIGYDNFKGIQIFEPDTNKSTWLPEDQVANSIHWRTTGREDLGVYVIESV